VTAPDDRTRLVGAMGVVVAVEVSGSRAHAVLEQLPVLWADCPAGPGAPDVRVRVVHDADPTVCAAAADEGAVAGTHLADLLQLLTQRITLAAIDALAGRHFLFHAACLADPGTGRAAAFVAPGGTGKTTLARTLGAGHWYVTDETVVVDDDGSVTPYPKPLSLRRTPTSPYKDETAPGALGLAAPAGPVRLAALAVLDRNDDHRGAPRVDRLEPLDAVVVLVPQMSHLPRMQQPLQRLVALVESLGGVHRVTYREAAELAAVLDEWVGAA
jgi:hypothetical protein